MADILRRVAILAINRKLSKDSPSIAQFSGEHARKVALLFDGSSSSLSLF